MIYISGNFKDTKKVDPILESLLDVQSFFDALNVIYQLSEIKKNVSRDFISHVYWDKL